MTNLFDIKDNVTVITGGTGVLGRTIAKYLALNGAKVIILGRKAEVGNAIADEIKAAGGECEFMKTDVMDKETVQKNCDDILAKYGRIDTLLNAAGGNMPGATPIPIRMCSTSVRRLSHRCSTSISWVRLYRLRFS